MLHTILPAGSFVFCSKMFYEQFVVVFVMLLMLLLFPMPCTILTSSYITNAFAVHIHGWGERSTWTRRLRNLQQCNF